jgi:dTDP-4-dehydrorhamnose reductase
MKKKIIIVGASSGIGKYLLNKLKKKFIVMGWTSKKNVTGAKYINYRKESFLNEIAKFDYIIYCSTISKFTTSNQNFLLSKFVNLGILNKIIDKINENQKLIFFSSYGVTAKFKYKKPAYIKLKILAEKKIKKKLNNFFIIRPAKIIDSIEAFQNKKKLNNFNFFEDKFIHITSNILIFRGVMSIIKHNYQGLLNLVSNDKISYLNLAKYFLKKKKLRSTKYLINKYSFKEPNIVQKNKKFLELYQNSSKIIRDAKSKY